LLALRLAVTEVAAASGIPYSSSRRLDHGLVVADPAAAAAKALARTIGVTDDQIMRAAARVPRRTSRPQFHPESAPGARG